jgi:hypothetical protein
MSCLNYGKRKYVNKDDPIVAGPNGGWNSADGDFGPYYNSTPQITVQYRSPSEQTNDQWSSGESASGLCGAEKSDYPGTNFQGCGDCRPGSGWWFCNCCVTEWNQNNISACCDPNPNNPGALNDAISCDPDWCPFSTACEKAESTATYCAANFDDPQCLQVCQKYISPDTVGTSRPDWCDTFMVKYCAAHKNDSLQNQNMCACSLQVTLADECILPSCSSGIGVWMSGEQLKRVANCGTICEQNIEAVKDHDVNINENEFIMHCGGGQKTYCNSSSPPVCISLNSSGDPGGGDGGDGGNGSGSTDSNGVPFKNWWGSYTPVTAPDGSVSNEIQLSPMGIGTIVAICLLMIGLLAFGYMNYRQNKLMQLFKSQNATTTAV